MGGREEPAGRRRAAIGEVRIGRSRLGWFVYRCRVDVPAIPYGRGGALTEGVEDGLILRAKGEYDVICEYDVLFLIVPI